MSDNNNINNNNINSEDHVNKIFQELNYRPKPECPYCWCKVVSKRWLTRSGDQRYLCKGCWKSFQENVAYRNDTKKAEHVYNAVFYYYMPKAFLVKYYGISVPYINTLIRQYREFLIHKKQPYFTNEYRYIDSRTNKELPTPRYDEYFKKIKTISVTDPISGFTDKKPVYLFQEHKPWPQVEPVPLYEPVSRRESFKNVGMTPPEIDPGLDPILDKKFNQELVDMIEDWWGIPEKKYDEYWNVILPEEPTHTTYADDRKQGK